MLSTDRSQTERLRRLRGQLQAQRIHEEGPQVQSTWLSRRFGQMTYRTQNAVGAVSVQPCCAPEGKL